MPAYALAHLKDIGPHPDILELPQQSSARISRRTGDENQIFSVHQAFSCRRLTGTLQQNRLATPGEANSCCQRE
jgi:hypothetical protein